MRWIADIKDTSSLYYTIQRDQKAGFYLNFYRDNFCIRDDLQDTFEKITNQASQEYNIPKDSWKSSKDQPDKWVAKINHVQPLQFFIEQDKESKFHMCIYQGDNKLYDNPRNSLDDAMNFALTKFQLPRTSWKEIQ